VGISSGQKEAFSSRWHFVYDY